MPLPFVGGNNIAHSQEFEVVEFHCKDSNTKATVMPPVGIGKYFEFLMQGSVLWY